MRYRWFILWILLFLCQLITLWLGSLHGRNGRPGIPAYMHSDVIGLSAEVEALYAESMPERALAFKSLSEGVETSPELQREELLLRLQDREDTLRLSGLDIRVTPVLQSWLSTSGTDPRSAGAEALFLQYSGSLLEWMEQVGTGVSPCLTRVLVQPEPASAFPAISFEGEGDAAGLGQILLSFPGGDEGWQLREFDMTKSPESSRWWMRGSFLFRQPGE